MLISDAKRALFVHVPKTGGMSIETAFRDACPDARATDPSRARRHAPLGKIIRVEPQTADYWSFGFVRNPWSRMVSWYSMIASWNRNHGPASGKPQDRVRGDMRDGNQMWRAVAAYGSFEEFVLRGPDEITRVGRAQIDYLRAPASGAEVDFIGRTENFAEDLQTVQRVLGVEPAPPPHRNRSRHGSYRDYYTEASRAKVAEVFAEDIDRFGYTF